ncbi:hypothetical protein [Romboutsia lituseburensis]|uniref:hypothetical protein n=1 Tax=Romboutsia lituseburensis TaxID=1537 RepID=UPI00215ADBDB|nr:hypothetical protein [Romboutsia lituseburensis]MCR8743822.1 hypothetical protein [Romboutsia lituseburensis]
MSQFLAPIHTWLFNKIKLAQDLESNIVKVHIDTFGEEVLSVQEEAIKLYGEYIQSKPLEELIDVNNIHGWLQNRIIEVESRSAYIISKYYDIYKEKSKELTMSEYKKQAIKCAKDESNKVNSPDNVYISLNNYILSGMPCDRATSITEKNDDYVIFEQAGCIHKKNYEKGNGNLSYLYKLKDLWIKSFVENLRVKYVYDKKENDGVTINTIRKV